MPPVWRVPAAATDFFLFGLGEAALPLPTFAADVGSYAPPSTRVTSAGPVSLAGCLATFGATTPNLAASLACTTLLRPPDFRRYWTASAIGSSIPARFSFGATSVISPAPAPPAAPAGFLVAAVAGLAIPFR